MALKSRKMQKSVILKGFNPLYWIFWLLILWTVLTSLLCRFKMCCIWICCEYSTHASKSGLHSAHQFSKNHSKIVDVKGFTLFYFCVSFAQNNYVVKCWLCTQPVPNFFCSFQHIYKNFPVFFSDFMCQNILYQFFYSN